MENNKYLNLPDLIELNQFGNDPIKLIEAAYECFKQDFILKKPIFRGITLALKKHPISQGKEITFWHMTSEGENETDRLPDLRRLERIRWPAFIINHSQHSYLKVWENKRGNKENILIFHEKESYLVVLRKGNGYILPWTAYLVKDVPRKKKLIKEYNAYIIAKPA